jgi:hypothetical protein
MTDSSYDENKGARVLKTDVLGRVETTTPQRETLLDEFERSGLSGTKFAAVVGVNARPLASIIFLYIESENHSRKDLKIPYKRLDRHARKRGNNTPCF